MNVKGLPAADSPYGIAAVFGTMAVSTVVLLALLKRFRWW
jgi:Mg2+ and Co2+ transporter CorA